jgi:hypothetical protein
MFLRKRKINSKNLFKDKGNVEKNSTSFTQTKDDLQVKKKGETFNLNTSTVEFEMNFLKEVEYKNKIFHQVKNNIDKKTYDDHRNKIIEERKKLDELKNKVLNRIEEKKIEYKDKSTVSEATRKEMLELLGSKKNSQKKKEDLSNIYIKSIINDLSNNIQDKTMEFPSIQEYYNDIFKDENKYTKEIEETLETQEIFLTKEEIIEIEKEEGEDSFEDSFLLDEEEILIPDETPTSEPKSNNNSIIDMVLKDVKADESILDHLKNNNESNSQNNNFDLKSVEKKVIDENKTEEIERPKN